MIEDIVRKYYPNDYPQGEDNFNPDNVPSQDWDNDGDDFLYEDLEGLTNEDLF